MLLMDRCTINKNYNISVIQWIDKLIKHDINENLEINLSTGYIVYILIKLVRYYILLKQDMPF